MQEKITVTKDIDFDKIPLPQCTKMVGNNKRGANRIEPFKNCK